MNIMLLLRILETRDWDHKLIKKMFTEVINTVGSKAHSSYANIQKDCFTPGVAPCWSLERVHFHTESLFQPLFFTLCEQTEHEKQHST